MSELLLNSFSDLKVMRSRPPSMKIQIALPNCPTKGHPCFYGYGVTIEWLIDYANKYWRLGPTDFDDSSKQRSCSVWQTLDLLHNSHCLSAPFFYHMMGNFNPSVMCL